MFRPVVLDLTSPNRKLVFGQKFPKYQYLLNAWILLILITKTYLYNFDPLKPHFYIVKLGFTGVYIIFHISAKNIDCGYSYFCFKTYVVGIVRTASARRF